MQIDFEDPQKVTHYDTNFGFMLVYEEDGLVEMHGLTGFGRYTLFATTFAGKDLFEAAKVVLKEHKKDVEVYCRTKRLLDADR